MFTMYIQYCIYTECFKSLHPISKIHICLKKKMQALVEVNYIFKIIKFNYLKNIFYFNSYLYLLFLNEYEFLKSDEDFWNTLYNIYHGNWCIFETKTFWISPHIYREKRTIISIIGLIYCHLCFVTCFILGYTAVVLVRHIIYFNSRKFQKMLITIGANVVHIWYSEKKSFVIGSIAII